MPNQPLILAIETSCDETAVAILKGRDQILADLVASQIDLHAKYGGIVPEVAARKHVETIIPLLKEVFKKAKIKPAEIDAIAVTHGPGLITSLMIGVDTAKGLALALKKPLIATNHLEAHIYSNFITNNKIKFPALCLIVSGGHTSLVLMKNHGEYKVVGETRDDAAGEAFDKVARLLNLGFPGGPVISHLADFGNSKSYQFPRPMLKEDNFDFSFSGLKTDVLRVVKKKKRKFSEEETVNLCASFQAAVIETLVTKTVRATQKFKVKTVMLAGGVASNKNLRRVMKREITNRLSVVGFQLPATKYCTDNAVMVGVAGYYHYLKKDFMPLKKIKTEANLSL